MNITSFPPLRSSNAKVLILGTMPGEESLTQGQYYTSRRNSLWHIMGELYGARQELPYAERVNILHEAGIALWDVLKHCEREGSLDSNISAEAPNDFQTFFADHPSISAVCFNGNRPQKYFNKLVKPQQAIPQGLTFVSLPSSSNSHAVAKSAKLASWGVLKEFIDG